MQKKPDLILRLSLFERVMKIIFQYIRGFYSQPTSWCSKIVAQCST
ncbi:hypothetical protein GII76_13830 [Bacillus subtilis]|nr:hypothetical protein GII76_13830 [Bacillus subtilis]QGI01471.1 hypothetical protein GII77_13670 [Bacillus subtilis]QGI05687.1 hypothetical protein GII78_14250 [Bacillus subtilis]QGI09878.1 hypothetical protein GII79_14175 [Bacillus subtilis]QGI18476.1 hypothetical protein GII81_14405 [Bacillus subtilis]